MYRAAESTALESDLHDARLESALQTSGLDGLCAVQEALQQLHRDGLTVAQMAVALQDHSADIALWLASRSSRDDTVKVTMLLAALSVAIAWQRYRFRSVPLKDVRRAIERIDAGVTYTLPIPRHKPCFCGSDDPYRKCHGQPPIVGMIA